MASRLKPYALLLLLALVFFIDLVVHPTQVLYSDYSDILALHLPDKMFLVRSFRETGELPLWCPYRFAGVPFIHDFQVGAWYPPHWLLLLFPEKYLGAAMSWLVVLHVVIAGWSMYAYARFRGLQEAGAIVAALGWMFSGKLLLHVLVGGHFNMLMLAWLPLAVMFLESALAQAGAGAWLPAMLRATWAGGIFALLVLTAYPYVTLYAGMLLAAWTLGPVLQQAGYLGGTEPRSRRRTAWALGRWVLLGGWSALVALALGAVQLLPALEAARYATRSGTLTNPFHETLWPLMFLTGPTLLKEPVTLIWEVRGGFGVLWIIVAALAPALQRGRIRFEAAVGVFFFLLALGGIVIFYWIPGVGMFRLPSRIFLVAAFPVAFLAGAATNALWCGAAIDPASFARCRTVFLKVLVWPLFLSTVVCILAVLGKNLQLHPYWLTLLATVPLMFWMLGKTNAKGRSRGTAERSRTELIPFYGTAAGERIVLLWCACLLLDLWALVWPEVRVRTQDEIYPVSASVAYLADHAGHHRVMDQDQQEEISEPEVKKLPIGLPPPPRHSAIPQCSPLGYGSPIATKQQIESLRGFNPVDIQRYKQYLQFITDVDEPVVPLDDTSTFGFPSIGNFRLVNWQLAELLDVRFLLLPVGQIGALDSDWQGELDDQNPRAFDFVDGGVQSLGTYRVYRSSSTLARAFVVPEAAPLPQNNEVLTTLKRTNFRRRVLLENFAKVIQESSAALPDGVQQDELIVHSGDYRPAEIQTYQPNNIVIDVPAGNAGFLVLADIWYPGWHCKVDGKEQTCYRANYLFRAVQLTEGAHKVKFTFEPEWYRRGLWISAAALAGLLVSVGIEMWMRLRGCPTGGK